MAHRVSKSLGIVLMLTIAFAADVAIAACTQSSEARTVKKSVRQAMTCDYRALRAGTTSCTVTPPPACAGTLVTDANNLAYGLDPLAEVDGKLLRDQLKCQKRIGKALSYYVGKKLLYLIKGKTAAEAEAKAVKQLDKLSEFCDVPVGQDTGTGLVLPRVGPQCAAAIGVPAGTVDTLALRNCLRQLGEVWVDRFGPNPQPLRPNIIFILTDDQRWDMPGTTHSLSAAPVMPRTIAELADQGVTFSQAFMTTPLCAPSRASILSGQYAHRTGVYKNGGNNGGANDFSDGATIGTWMQSAGYTTSLMGKYMNGYPQLWTNVQPPYVPPGWTEWRGMKSVKYFDYVMVEPNGLGGYVENAYGSADSDYSTDVLREKAKDFISSSVTANEPFFLYLAFKATHLPQIPAPRHEGLFQTVPPWRPPSYNEADVSDKPLWVQNTPLLDAAAQADIDQIRIDQLEMAQAVDEAIGGSTTYGIVGIMEHLRNLGIADNTIVVYFADNGWLWGEHRMRAKNKPFEEPIRSPMFVYYPKLAPLPRTETRFALNIDIAPTLLGLAGGTATIAQSGESLVQVIDGTQPTWRTDFLTEGWPNGHPWATVREERMNGQEWKYSETPVTPGDPNTTFEKELYELVSDPYEQTNVASDPQHAARITAMAARLRQLRQNWPTDSDPNGPDPDEEDDP
jgi:arylsulfatase A-like enzyme/uncharacterized membrane protein